MPTKKKTATRKSVPAPRAAAKPRTFEGTIDSIAAKFTATGVSVLKTLDSAKAELAPLVEIHEQLTGAIDARRAELSTLGEVGDAFEKLDDLQLKIAADTEDHERRLDQFRQEEREEKARIKRERDREQESYEYDTQLTRTRATDEFNAKMARAREEARQELDLLQAERDAVATLQEELSARDAEITQKLPDAIEAAVKDAKREAAIAANTVARDHKLAARELELRLEQREQRISDLETALRDAAIKLEAAEERAADVAQRAIDASSGRAALDALQKQTQASAGGNGRR